MEASWRARAHGPFECRESRGRPFRRGPRTRSRTDAAADELVVVHPPRIGVGSTPASRARCSTRSCNRHVIEERGQQLGQLRRHLEVAGRPRRLARPDGHRETRPAPRDAGDDLLGAVAGVPGRSEHEDGPPLSPRQGEEVLEVRPLLEVLRHPVQGHLLVKLRGAVLGGAPVRSPRRGPRRCRCPSREAVRRAHGRRPRSPKRPPAPRRRRGRWRRGARPRPARRGSRGRGRAAGRGHRAPAGWRSTPPCARWLAGAH